MAGLDSIPDEILLNIVSYVGSIRDFAALSMQCRRLHNFIDMPVRKRFHRIRLIGLKREQKPVVARQLLDMLKEPKLAQYVRELEIGRPWRATLVEPIEGRDENVKLIMSAIRYAGFWGIAKSNVLLKLIVQEGEVGDFEILQAGNKRGRTFLYTNFEQAIGVLLIALCPNIAILRVAEPRREVLDVLKRINSKNPKPTALQRLRDVRLEIPSERYDAYSRCNFGKCMRCFHRLPCIESISVSSICIDQRRFFKLAPRMSNISKIFIDHSTISTYKLRTIIEHPKTLREFRYTVGGRMVLNRREMDCRIQPNILGKTLQLHKSSLRALDLDADSVVDCYQGISADTGELMSESDGESIYSDEESDFDNNGDLNEPRRTMMVCENLDTTIGSFRDFTALTHLSIGKKLLLGEDEEYYRRNLGDAPPTYCLADRLPPHLEYLCIRGFTKDDDEHYTKAVFEMMETRAKCLPNLKEVQGVAEYLPNSKHVGTQEASSDGEFGSDPDSSSENNGSDGNDD